MFLHRNVKKYIYIASMYIFPVLFCFFFPIILFPFGWFSFVILTAGPLQLWEVFGKNVFLFNRKKTSFSLWPFSWGFKFVLSAWHGQCWGYFVRLHSKMTVYTTPPPTPPPPKKIYIYNKIQISSTYNIICL